MHLFNNMNTRYFIFTLFRGLLLPSLLAGIAFVPAQITYAAEERACSITKIQDELIALRDSADANEREAEELTLRIALLNETMDCSLIEIDQIGTKLNDLSGLTEEEEGYRDKFMENIEEYHSYYAQQKESISDEEITSVGTIKERAKEILEWRDSTYNTGIDQIVNFIFLVDGRVIRETAQVRLEKITAALKKIRLAEHESVQGFLAEAQTHIKTADDLQNEAYDKFLAMISPAEEQSEGIAQMLVATEEQENATTTEEVAPTEEAAAAEEAVEEIEEETARDLIQESFGEIRGAYENFLQISSLVKKLLGL